MRSPQEMMDDWYDGCQGVADVDMDYLLGEIIEAITEQYKVTMKMVEVPDIAIQRVQNLMNTYIAMNFPG